MSTSGALLSLRELGVAFGDSVVENGVNLEFDGPDVLVLMGPVGTGKSTLLRTIAGINQVVPSFRTWGAASYAGAALDGAHAPALVSQNARLLMSSVLENIISEFPERQHLTPVTKREVAKQLLTEAGLESLLDHLDHLDRAVVDLPLAVQRHLAMARTAASNPLLLCVDEPTANIGWEESLPLLHFLRDQGKQRGVLVVSHNQQDALELGGHTALLAGGAIQSLAPVKQFFEQPGSPIAADFVRTGSCCMPSPGANPEEVDESMLPLLTPLPAAATNYARESLGPRGFMWLKKGVLAGTPRPGVMQDIEYDVEALKRVGVTTLVSLTTQPVDPVLLERYGIQGLWLPIKDMQAPSVEEADQMCRHVTDRMTRGHVVAYHCRAGLGRTGTMLAVHLIMEGKTAMQALESVRRVEHRWVQSDEQVRFLERFAKFLSSRQKENGQPAEI
jgi:atypical dual specificity phosphatase